MSGQDEILKDVIYNINKTNHELNRLKIILKHNKKQLRHKNIIISFLIVIIIGLSVFSDYLLNSKNKTPTTAWVYYKDSNSAIVTNNKLDNDSQININQKEYK